MQRSNIHLVCQLYVANVVCELHVASEMCESDKPRHAAQVVAIALVEWHLTEKNTEKRKLFISWWQTKVTKGNLLLQMSSLC